MITSYADTTGSSNFYSTDASIRTSKPTDGTCSLTDTSYSYYEPATAVDYKIVTINEPPEVLGRIFPGLEELQLLFEKLKAIVEAHILLLNMALDFVYLKPIIKFVFIRPLFYRKCFMSLKTFQNLRFK